MFTVNYNMWVRSGTEAITLRLHPHEKQHECYLKTEWKIRQHAKLSVYRCLFRSKFISVSVYLTAFYRQQSWDVGLHYSFNLTLLQLKLSVNPSPLWPCFNIWRLTRNTASTLTCPLMSLIRDTLKCKPSS